MRTSSETLSLDRRPSRRLCPRCGSLSVESEDYALVSTGILTRTVCRTCGLWVANCAFKKDGKMEYRGFLREGAIPQDIPLKMKEIVARWP